MISKLAIKRVKGAEPEYVTSLRIIEDFGVEGDCHATGVGRAVCIITKQTEENLSRIKDKPCISKFSPNIVIDTMNMFTAGDILRINSVELIVTSVGRECHQLCDFHGCPLINGIIFASVRKGGIITVGDNEEYA